jgi:hypothetical protein
MNHQLRRRISRGGSPKAWIPNRAHWVAKTGLQTLSGLDNETFIRPVAVSEEGVFVLGG